MPNIKRQITSETTPLWGLPSRDITSSFEMDSDVGYFYRLLSSSTSPSIRCRVALDVYRWCGCILCRYSNMTTIILSDKTVVGTIEWRTNDDILSCHCLSLVLLVKTGDGQDISPINTTLSFSVLLLIIRFLCREYILPYISLNVHHFLHVFRIHKTVYIYHSYMLNDDNTLTNNF